MPRQDKQAGKTKATRSPESWLPWRLRCVRLVRPSSASGKGPAHDNKGATKRERHPPTTAQVLKTHHLKCANAITMCFVRSTRLRDKFHPEYRMDFKPRRSQNARLTFTAQQCSPARQRDFSPGKGYFSGTWVELGKGNND